MKQISTDSHRISSPGHVVLAILAFTLFTAACAPITPLPGPKTNLPIPSSGGLPGGSSPAPVPGMPGPSPVPGGQPGGQQPGGQPSSQGGSPSGQSSGGQQSGGGGAGGTPSSYDPPPGGGSSIPGGSVPGQSGSGSGSGGGSEGNTGWEDVPGGSDEGDWQTSNEELPEENQGSGGSSSGDGDPDNSDSELDEVLKDFDGEILSEREVINSTPSQGASTAILIPTEDEDVLSHDGGGNTQAPSSTAPPRKKAIPNAPAPPRRGAEIMPDDIPDAKDDDIIARQLREAAMQEEDPQLKEKLWDEYRKYKNS